MNVLDPREFGRLTAEGRPCGHYDFSLYHGLRFDCACGETHDFKPWMEIVNELPLFRFIVACPDGVHLTVVKARWNRDENLRELVAEMGTALPHRRAAFMEHQQGVVGRRSDPGSEE